MTKTLASKIWNGVKLSGKKVLVPIVIPVIALSSAILYSKNANAEEPKSKINTFVEETFLHTPEADSFYHWFGLGQKGKDFVRGMVTDEKPLEGKDKTTTSLVGRVYFEKEKFNATADILGETDSQGNHFEGINVRGNSGSITSGGAIEESIDAEGERLFMNQAYLSGSIGPVDILGSFVNRNDIETRTSGISAIGINIPLGFFLGGGIEMDGEENAIASYVVGRYTKNPGKEIGFRLSGINDNNGNNSATLYFATGSEMGEGSITRPISVDNGSLDKKLKDINWFDSHPYTWDCGSGPFIAKLAESWNQTMSMGQAEAIGQVPLGEHVLARVGATYSDRNEEDLDRTQIAGGYIGGEFNNFHGIGGYLNVGATENFGNGQRDFN